MEQVDNIELVKPDQGGTGQIRTGVENGIGGQNGTGGQNETREQKGTVGHNRTGENLTCGIIQPLLTVLYVQAKSG